jgi:hypothetical protein
VVSGCQNLGARAAQAAEARAAVVVVQVDSAMAIPPISAVVVAAPVVAVELVAKAAVAAAQASRLYRSVQL